MFRIPCHQQTLLRALLKLVSDVYSQSGGGEVSAANQKLVAPLTECFVLLGQCCEDIKVWETALMLCNKSLNRPTSPPSPPSASAAVLRGAKRDANA